jgi:hypothetical protein
MKISYQDIEDSLRFHCRPGPCLHRASNDDRCLVGALCEGRAIQRQSIWCAGLSSLSRSSNQTNEIDQGNRMNQRPATRRENGSYHRFSLPDGRAPAPRRSPRLAVSSAPS